MIGTIGIDKTFEPAFGSASYVDLLKTPQKLQRNHKSSKQAKLPKGFNLDVTHMTLYNPLKGLLCIFVFYVYICSIPVVNAIDVSNENELTSALLSRSPDDAINFTDNITLSQSLAELDRTLTINGNAHTLSGNSSFRLFSPIHDGNLTFENITFEYGNASGANDEGGVFQFLGGNINFLNAIAFKNNTADNFGGAIGNTKGIVQFGGVGHVLFEQNSVKNSNGGAIYNKNLLTFQNTGNLTFQENLAANGGALYNIPETPGDTASVLFENTGDIVFSENKTKTSGSGGGIFNRDQIEFSNVGNIIFKKNDADYRGGAIYNQFATLKINNRGNVLFQDNSTVTGEGGAIMISSSTVELAPQNGYTVTFEENFAGSTRNAIYIEDSTLLLNPEQKATILFYDPIASSNSTNNTITQNADGTTKIWGENTGYLGDTEILRGAFKLMGPDSANHSWLIDPAVFGTTTSGTFTLANNATLGLWVHESDITSHATLNANMVKLMDGSRLYVTGISLVPKSTGEIVYANVIQTSLGSGNGSNNLEIPQSMQNTNSLTHFELVNNINMSNADLKISYLKNISDVIGLDYKSWDDIRLDPNTPDDLRTFLDDMYNAPNDDLLNSLIKNTQGNPTVESSNAHRQSSVLFNGVLISRIHGIGFEDHLNGLSQYTDEDTGYGVPSCYGHKQFCRESTELWGMFSQNWTRLNPSSRSNGYKYAPYSFTIGKERTMDRFLYGIAGQYYQGHVTSFGRDFTQTKIQGGTLGLYGAYMGHRNYLHSTMQFGVGWNDEISHVNGVDLDASYHSALLGTSLEFGHRCHIGKVSFTPHVGVDYTFYHSEAFKENGPANIARSFGSVNCNVVELPFGVRLTRGFYSRKYGISWMPTLDLTYARSVADNVSKTTANFAATPNAHWIATSSNIGRDVFRMTTGSMGRFQNGWDLGLSYDLETRNRYTSHQLNAMIAWRR